MNNEKKPKLHLQNVRQRFYSWLQKVNEKHKLIMIWWRYDNEGEPHKIGWRLFDGKLFIRYRNVA